MNDSELFQEVLDRMAETYPHREIKMVGTLVYIDGESRLHRHTVGDNATRTVSRAVAAYRELETQTLGLRRILLVGTSGDYKRCAKRQT